MMKTRRTRNGRSKHCRKLGKMSLDTAQMVNDTIITKELVEIPGHFMYNEEHDAIEQVLKLPDVTVYGFTEDKESTTQDICLPQIRGEDKGFNKNRKHTTDFTKLPRIKERREILHRKSSWLEIQDLSVISWQKALDILSD